MLADIFEHAKSEAERLNVPFFYVSKHGNICDSVFIKLSLDADANKQIFENTRYTTLHVFCMANDIVPMESFREKAIQREKEGCDYQIELGHKHYKLKYKPRKATGNTEKIKKAITKIFTEFLAQEHE